MSPPHVILAEGHDTQSRMQPDSITRIRNAAAGILIVSGLLILVGWQFRIPLLKGDMLGTFVAPLTALLFILCGASVRMQCARVRWLTWAGLAAGALVALTGAVLLLEHATGRSLGSQLFFAHRLDDWYVIGPRGRIALPSSLAFFAAGISLLFLRARRLAYVSEMAASAVAAVAYLAISGYLFNLESLYGRVMALPTALLLLPCAAMLYAASARGLLVSVIFGEGAGSMALRRIGPAVVVLLPVIGWLRLMAQRADLVSLEQATALHVMVVAILFGWIAWSTAVTLNRLDAERKRAHEALVRGEKLAAAGRLAATVAHEINNPLEAVINILFLARREPKVPPSVVAWLEKADSELLRVAQITRQTLGFYRGSTGMGSVPLRSTIAEIIQLYSRRAAEKNATLRQGQSDGIVIADAGELRQVIGNLVSNALDAVPDDGTGVVAVTVHDRDEDRIELRVTDNGPGIPPETYDRLFEPFFTTKEVHGTGLGLFVTRQLVEKNGGTLELISHSGGDTPSGTTAVVLCRRAAALAAAEKAS